MKKEFTYWWNRYEDGYLADPNWYEPRDYELSPKEDCDQYKGYAFRGEMVVKNASNGEVVALLLYDFEQSYDIEPYRGRIYFRHGGGSDDEGRVTIYKETDSKTYTKKWLDEFKKHFRPLEARKFRPEIKVGIPSQKCIICKNKFYPPEASFYIDTDKTYTRAGYFECVGCCAKNIKKDKSYKKNIIVVDD